MSVMKEVLEKALALPQKDRARVARKLLLSLDDQPREPGWEAAWTEEIERRSDDVHAGTAKLTEASKVLRELRADLKKRRKR